MEQVLQSWPDKITLVQVQIWFDWEYLLDAFEKKNYVRTLVNLQNVISSQEWENTSITLLHFQFPGKTYSQWAQYREPVQDSSSKTCIELKFHLGTVGEIVVTLRLK